MSPTASLKILAACVIDRLLRYYSRVLETLIRAHSWESLGRGPHVLVWAREYVYVPGGWTRGTSQEFHSCVRASTQRGSLVYSRLCMKACVDVHVSGRVFANVNV